MKIEGKQPDTQKKGKKPQRERTRQAFGFSIRVQNVHIIPVAGEAVQTFKV